MSAQLLLTPSLFEMSDLAKSRFNERTEETSLNMWINWVKVATPDNLVRREMEITVDDPAGYREQLEIYGSNFCWAMHYLENEEENDGPEIAPRLTTWFHQYLRQTRHVDGELISKLPKWWFTNRTERGSAAAKSIIRSVNKLYPEKSENFSRRKKLLNIVHEWAELAALYRSGAKKKYLVVASREPNAFMRLGHMKCENGSDDHRLNSCYRSGGEYHAAPLNLGLAKNCYVFYVKEKDGVGPNSEYVVVGRAWGYLDADNMAFTNTYGNHFTGGREAIVEILRVAAEKWTGKTALSGKEITKWVSPPGQWDNRDTQNRLSTKEVVRFESVGERYHGNSPPQEEIECPCCEEVYDQEDCSWVEGEGEFVCEGCLCSCYSWIDSVDEYVHENRCSYDDFSGETILSCEAQETYCGQTCHEEDATYIDLGEHAGSYAHNEDENLLSDRDGEYYIEGTRTTEEKLNESEADDD